VVLAMGMQAVVMGVLVLTGRSPAFGSTQMVLGNAVRMVALFVCQALILVAARTLSAGRRDVLAAPLKVLYAAALLLMAWIVPGEMIGGGEPASRIAAVFAGEALLVVWFARKTKYTLTAGCATLLVAHALVAGTAALSELTASGSVLFNATFLVILLTTVLVVAAVWLVRGVTSRKWIPPLVETTALCVASLLTVAVSLDCLAHGESRLLLPVWWSAAGLVVIEVARRMRLRLILGLGVVLAVLAATKVLVLAIEGYGLRGVTLLNSTTLLLALATVMAGATGWWLERLAVLRGRYPLARVSAVCAAAIGVVILTTDVWLHAMSRGSPLGAHALVSVLWAAYAAAAVVTGFVRGSVTARGLGLALFGVLLGKVALVDLAGLPTVYRVLSFLAAGLALIGVSALYGRRARAATDSSM